MDQNNQANDKLNADISNMYFWGGDLHSNIIHLRVIYNIKNT